MITNHQIIMISEGSCDTFDRSNEWCRKCFAFAYNREQLFNISQY